MEQITSRKNPYIQHLRRLASDAAYRRETGEFVGDSPKLMEEAVRYGAEITSILRKSDDGIAAPPLYEQANETDGGTILPEREPRQVYPTDTGIQTKRIRQYYAPRELFSYASPMTNSPGPIFTARLPEQDLMTPFSCAVVLENIQDPGNIGTVIRSANAFGIGAVILTGDCADRYSPKTVRASMGALFRQRVIRVELRDLPALLERNGLRLYGAVLSDRAESILKKGMTGSCAVAIGNEGRGLSAELRAMCAGELIIPMEPSSESLNAAVAASVIMWEMKRRRDGTE